MMPVVSLYTLIDELKTQFNINTTHGKLKQILWYEAPANDSYKMYFYGDGVIEGCDPIEACIITLLEDLFPQYEEILIDVSW